MEPRFNRHSLFGTTSSDPEYTTSAFPGQGVTLGRRDPSPWSRRLVLNTDDEEEPVTRRVDSSSSSQGAMDSSPGIDRRHLDVPTIVHRRHTRSSTDRRRSFHTPEEMERRRSYYTEEPVASRRASRSDLSASSSQEDDASTSTYAARRRFYLSESDSDEIARSAYQASQRTSEARERRRSNPPRRDYYSGIERSRTNSDSTSDDERRSPSAYSSCSSVNEIVDRFRDYNRRVRDMVVNSFADLDEGMMINQGTSTSRQPQLGFHSIHGQNLILQANTRIARRKESFCKGLAFSNRPIGIDEIVCLRLTEVTMNWSGVMRFGVTSVNPEVYRGGTIPKFACPDLTNKDGYWAKAVPERYSVEGNMIHFYVTEAGELFYGINGVQKGIFLTNINVDTPLWAMVDIYGNSVAVEFVDVNDAKLRAARSLITATAPARPAPPVVPPPPTIRPPAPIASSSHSNDANVRNNLGGVELDLLQFHKITGRHVNLNSIQTMATKNPHEYTQGYVFTERPVRLNEKVVVEITHVQPLFTGSLAFGVTCCNPQSLQGKDLPDDSYALIEMPDYFVGIKDVALNPVAGTTLQFWITANGEVKMQKDQKSARTIMHVDASLQLYMWFDVYGETQGLRLLGCCPLARAPSTSTTAASTPSTASTAMPTRVALPVLPSTTTRRRPDATSPARDMAHSNSSPTPLRVALEGLRSSESASASSQRAAPPPPMRGSNIFDLVSSDLPLGGPPALVPSGSSLTPTRISYTGSHDSSPQTSSTNPFAPTLMPRRTSPTTPTIPPPPRLPLPPRPASESPARASPANLSMASSISTNTFMSAPAGGADDGDEADECTICMNAKINCVIYKCGHMCMCYDCAIQLKDQRGECPICRNEMADVIKCFKS